MSYAIKYDTGTSQKFPERKAVFTNNKMKVTIIGLIILTVIAAFFISPIKRWLLPGDPVITERAIVKMVDELQAGEGLQEAVTTFCREVIQGGLTG